MVDGVVYRHPKFVAITRMVYCLNVGLTLSINVK